MFEWQWCNPLQGQESIPFPLPILDEVDRKCSFSFWQMVSWVTKLTQQSLKKDNVDGVTFFPWIYLLSVAACRSPHMISWSSHCDGSIQGGRGNQWPCDVTRWVSVMTAVHRMDLVHGLCHTNLDKNNLAAIRITVFPNGTIWESWSCSIWMLLVFFFFEVVIAWCLLVYH